MIAENTHGYLFVDIHALLKHEMKTIAY